MGDFIANLGNALTYGGTVAVIGMVIVFVGLILLILCIRIMAGIFDRINAKKEAEEKAAMEAAQRAAQQAAASAPEAAEPVVEETPVCDDAELIAVIAAAIAAFDNSGKRLVVREVRRVSGWNRSSREEQVCRF